jgi:hypothetical protein
MAFLSGSSSLLEHGIDQSALDGPLAVETFYPNLKQQLFSVNQL